MSGWVRCDPAAFGLICFSSRSLSRGVLEICIKHGGHQGKYCDDVLANYTAWYKHKVAATVARLTKSVDKQHMLLRLDHKVHRAV
jgi:hypothetical protein